MKCLWQLFLKLAIASIISWSMISVSISQTATKDAAKPLKTQTQSNTTANVFILPRLFDLPTKTFVDMQVGRYSQAHKSLQFMTRWFPFAPAVKYDPKGYAARRYASQLVLRKLSAVFEKSYRAVKKIPQDRYLVARKRYLEFTPLIKKAIEAVSKKSTSVLGRPSPRKIVDLKAVVDSKNTGWDPRLNVLKTLFKFDTKKPELKKPVGGGSPAAQQVNEWYAQGLAAGNYGDIYDNRDNGHSRLRPKTMPQMSATVYGNEARASRMHYGLNLRSFYNAITLGNSSTALNGKLWRSQPRFALTTPGSPSLLYLQYTTNHLYFYPEHHDHDAKRGDLMPANTPYMIISQGSSGSDQPFIKAIATILAAFKPEVKAALKKVGMIMPTVQMIFRRGQKNIDSDKDYLNGKAHPAVFQSENTDLLKMVKRANSLTIKDVPPMVGLKVLEESGFDKEIDSLPGGMNGKLFDTPGAIARVVRSVAYEKQMLVQVGSKSIQKTKNASYHWVVLRGDADRIRIIPKNASRSIVEIFVPWHERSVVPGRPDLMSDRVDIGVFSGNGSQLSAPAFISLIYPGHQKRLYNDNKQILSADYRDPDYNKRYTDPIIFPVRDWSDTYQYDVQGRLIGWKRRSKQRLVEYTRHGAIVLERDKRGRALKAQKVDYQIEQDTKRRQKIAVRRLSEFLYYQYANDEDRIGSLTGG